MKDKNEKRKILVAMSGGVDSSVAAYLLKKEGHGVIGVTMKLFCYGEAEAGPKSCCSLDSISDAKKVCEKLGIQHYVISSEKEFENKIIDNFVQEYKKGRTPNPCIRCNQLIKFDFLLKKAAELGCDYLATGHYARISGQIADNPPSPEAMEGRAVKKDTNYKLQATDYNGFKLLKGVDERKDQSYFLYRLGQEQLAKIIFPLGELTKSEVRKIAEKAELETAQKAESQEICFVTGSDTTDYLKKKIPPQEGDIVDAGGNVVGHHQGISGYTIGQRKGLGGGFLEPMFVVSIDAKNNKIVVGNEEDLYSKIVHFSDAIWIGDESLGAKNLKAKIRYNMEEVEVSSLIKKDEGYEAIFSKPVRAVTPGQSIVFYEDDVCLGGGVIERSTHTSFRP